MRREMAGYLQKRKFRLVTRWKRAMKQGVGSLPSQGPFPYSLIFRAFDEIVRVVKGGPLETQVDAGPVVLAAVGEEARPTADEYMELFLSGRDVLGEFVRSDPTFCALFAAPDRQAFGEAVERAFRLLIDREMREYARRFGSPVSR